MRVADFDFDLPERLIAQEPATRRDASRLLVVDRRAGTFRNAVFRQLPDFLQPGDLLVVNNTRVFPARLLGRRLRSDGRGEEQYGAKVEVFLVRELGPLLWEALVKPGKAMREGARVEFEKGTLVAEVVEHRENGRRVIRFTAAGDFTEVLDRLGRTPLPPYIRRPEEAPAQDQRRLDAERYQTVFARHRGAIAAPTAGLHFTPELFADLQSRGVDRAEITLHVGYGTFQPVTAERVEDHRVEPEFYSIAADAADRINGAIQQRRRIIAVGTTTTRALESAAKEQRSVVSGQEQESGGGGRGAEGDDQRDEPDASPVHLSAVAYEATDLFIYPGFEFQVLGGLVTNFHLPRSSLLMLVSAFAGRDLILAAYRHAVAENYRFYSYGDAMLIL